MRKLGIAGGKVESSAVGDGGEEDYGFYSPRVSMELLDHRRRPRRSFHRPISVTSPLSCMNRRRSFCYDRLQKLPIRLTVVKLNGSKFEIEVQRCGRIADIKQAVERAFDHMPNNGPSKISWQYVWGHFCLCYDHQKLLGDEEFIKDYGMREGDELSFVHHAPASLSPKAKQTPIQDDIQEMPGICELNEAREQEAEEAKPNHLQTLVDDKVSTSSKESTSTSAHSRKKWLPHPKPDAIEKQKLKDERCTPKATTGFMGYVRSIFHVHSNKTANAPRC